MLLPTQLVGMPDTKQTDGGHVTYVVDRGLLKFGKFAGFALALFLVIGGYFFGFKLEKAVDELREVEKSLTEAQIRLAKAQSELDQATETVKRLNADVESTLWQAKQYLQEITVQRELAIAIVISMKDLTPEEKVKLEEVKNDPSSPIRVGSKGNLWAVGAVIRIAFLGGTAIQRNKVKTVAVEWTKHANLTFDFSEAVTSDVRVGFEVGGGSWSYLGTSSLAIPQKESTINFGWLSEKTDIAKEERQVILHEFGHVLGLVEEHLNPNANIEWNKEAVYAGLSGPPNLWDNETIEKTIFKKFTVDDLPDYRNFDPESVMHLGLPPNFYRSTHAIRPGLNLSESDKNFASKLYPR